MPTCQRLVSTYARERATTLHFFGEMQQERQRERGQTVLSLSQIHLLLPQSHRQFNTCKSNCSE